jgi:hypothetical protein
MRKKSRKTKHRIKRHRNAGPAPIGPTRRHRLRLPRRGPPPDWKTTVAAIAGGAGGAALGGLVVNQQILSPEAVGIGMMGLGGATAYFADGNTRVLGNSVAAAGAGQLALALMAKRAIATDRVPAATAPPPPTAPAPPRIGPGAPAPAPSGTPRKSATGGGVVVDLFRDAALELEQLDEDEWRFGTRDAEAPGGVDVYDLDLDLDDAA